MQYFKFVLRSYFVFLSHFRFDLHAVDAFQSGTIPTGTLCANLDWLQNTLLPKLKNWSETFKIEDINAAEGKLHSLSLIDVEEYAKVYNDMKSRYAQSLVEVGCSSFLAESNC